MEFKYKNIIDHLNNSNQLFINNENNSYILNYFLRKRYLPLRFAYLKKIKTLSSFPKVIKYFDLPYIFPSKKDYLWRYNAIPYGAFFDKSRKDFLYFYSMGLKKNIGLLASFFVNYNNPQDHLHTSDWIESYFLFSKSLIEKTDSFQITKNFYTTSNLIALAVQIKNKKFHRIINSSKIDINPWLTTFDSRFITYDISSYNYKPNNLSKNDYIWGVNNHFICPSFFIDSFDTKIVLYTELYFKFKDKSYKFNKLFKKKNFFFSQSSLNFYKNIINILENTYKKQIKLKYQNIKIFVYKNFLFVILFLFFGFLKKNQNKYSFFKPSQIKKSFLLKSYFYGKVRKTQYRKISVLKFRLYYYKKLPSFLKIRNRSNLYPHFFLRTIVYRYSLKILVKKISLYIKNFFIYFLNNLKNRFLNYLIYDNPLLFIKELLFVIKRYFILNKILEKNKNKFNVNRYIMSVIKKNNKINNNKYNYDKKLKEYKRIIPIKFFNRKKNKVHFKNLFVDNLIKKDIISFEEEWKTQSNLLKNRFGNKFDVKAFTSNYKKAKLIISNNINLSNQIKPLDGLNEFEDKWKTKLNSFKVKFGKKFDIKFFVSNYKKAKHLMLLNKIKEEKDIRFEKKKINLDKFNINHIISYNFKYRNKILLFKLLLNLNNKYYLLFKEKNIKLSLNKGWNKLVYELIKLYYLRYEKKRRD